MNHQADLTSERVGKKKIRPTQLTNRPNNKLGGIFFFAFVGPQIVKIDGHTVCVYSTGSYPASARIVTVKTVVRVVAGAGGESKEKLVIEVRVDPTLEGASSLTRENNGGRFGSR